MDPAWSPDAARIAFSSTRDGNEELYVQDVGGGGLRRLTEHPSDDRGPTWSPDGGSIAFWSDRGGAAGIYVMDADGANVVNLRNP